MTTASERVVRTSSRACRPVKALTVAKPRGPRTLSSEREDHSWSFARSTSGGALWTSTAGIAIWAEKPVPVRPLPDRSLYLHIPCVRSPNGQCSHPSPGLILSSVWWHGTHRAAQVVLHYGVPKGGGNQPVAVTHRDERRIECRVVAPTPRIAVRDRQPADGSTARFWLDMLHKV